LAKRPFCPSRLWTTWQPHFTRAVIFSYWNCRRTAASRRFIWRQRARSMQTRWFHTSTMPT